MLTVTSLGCRCAMMPLAYVLLASALFFYPNLKAPYTISSQNMMEVMTVLLVIAGLMMISGSSETINRQQLLGETKKVAKKPEVIKKKEVTKKVQ